MPGRFCKENLPSPRSFYEHRFQFRSVDRKGWTRVKCCFHSPDRNPSLNLNIRSGQFVCFSCGTKGQDIIAFLMKREEISFKAACMKLGAWQSPTTRLATELLSISTRQQQSKRQALAAEEQAERERQRKQRIAVCGELHALETHYRRISQQLTELGPGHAEAEYCWECLALLLLEIRQAEQNYFQLSGLRGVIRGN